MRESLSEYKARDIRYARAHLGPEVKEGHRRHQYWKGAVREESTNPTAVGKVLRRELYPKLHDPLGPSAARLVALLRGMVLPKGALVRSGACGRPLCMKHLRVVSASARTRHSWRVGPRRHVAPYVTDAMALDILIRAAAGQQNRVIATEVGVTGTTVVDVKTGRTHRAVFERFHQNQEGVYQGGQ